MKNIIVYGLVFLSTSLLFSCGKNEADIKASPSLVGEPDCGENCDEADLNAPDDPSEIVPDERIDDVAGGPEQEPEDGRRYRMPTYRKVWGIAPHIYKKTANYYDSNYENIRNKRFVSILDFSQHSSKKRWYLFDLKNRTVERYLTSHGKYSDRNGDGYADSFSNVPGTAKSSLGVYVTAMTYRGKNGLSLRIKGKEATNSNAYRRAIVVHPARYVNHKSGRAGKSWGCPALDPLYSASVIHRIKNGSLFVIEK